MFGDAKKYLSMWMIWEFGNTELFGPIAWSRPVAKVALVAKVEPAAKDGPVSNFEHLPRLLPAACCCKPQKGWHC